MTESNEANETEKAIIGGYVLVAVIALFMVQLAVGGFKRANTPDAKGDTDA